MINIRLNFISYSITRVLYIFCLFILTAFYILNSASSVYAQEFSLGISPQIIKTSAKPGQKINSNLEIENFSSKPITLDVTFKEFTASDYDDNQIQLIPNSEEFINLLNNISISLDTVNINRLSLSPKQKQRITLELNIPDTLRKRDYYFTILFTEVSSNINPEIADSSYSEISGGIGTNVLLSVGNNDNEKMEIKEFSTPFLVSKSPVYFSIQAQNSGMHLINPQGKLRIYNMFGHLIGDINLPRLNILAKRSRKYYEPETLNRIYINTIKDINLDQKIIWSEKILFGLYRAELKFTLENGENISQSIRFLVLPYRFLISGLIIIFLLWFIKNRIYYYLNR